MSVQKDESGKRWVQAEVIVPGTPEEVWAAIATGQGVSSWFVPTEMQADGTVISHFGPGMDAVAKQTASEPPLRFAAVSEMGPGAPQMATEWTVEARDGGTCVVRVVHSLFASTDDWDDQLGAVEQGWPDYFAILQLYLRHFRGQPSAAFQLMGMACQTPDAVWRQLVEPLGLLAAHTGERLRSQHAQLQFAGVVERTGEPGHPQQLLLRLEEPTPGVAHLFAMPMGPTVVVSARFYWYGQHAARTVELHEPAWRAWLEKLFPPPPAEAAEAACAETSKQPRIQARAAYRFRAPAERVYDAWLDPAQVRAWMTSSLQSFGLAGDLRRVEIEPRVGGTFCFSDMRNGVEAVHHGSYLELDRPRKIVFTWSVGDKPDPDPSRVTVTIEPADGGCVGTIVHDMAAEWVDYVARTAAGWTRMLEAIGRLLGG